MLYNVGRMTGLSLALAKSYHIVVLECHCCLSTNTVLKERGEKHFNAVCIVEGNASGKVIMMSQQKMATTANGTYGDKEGQAESGGISG